MEVKLRASVGPHVNAKRTVDRSADGVGYGEIIFLLVTADRDNKTVRAPRNRACAPVPHKPSKNICQVFVQWKPCNNTGGMIGEVQVFVATLLARKIGKRNVDMSSFRKLIGCRP